MTAEGQAAAIQWYEETIDELQATLLRATREDVRQYITQRITKLRAHVKKLKAVEPSEPRVLVLQT